MLVAGGSSILAGTAPKKTAGWSCGVGEEKLSKDYFLENCSLSGSGLAVKGEHILDPRTGGAARRKRRAWALADTAAESDALSTAAMVLREKEIAVVVSENPDWLIFLQEENEVRSFGTRNLPAS